VYVSFLPQCVPLLRTDSSSPQLRQAQPYRLFPQADRSLRYPRVHPHRSHGSASFPSFRAHRGAREGRRRCR
jgi:hypothetical protein